MTDTLIQHGQHGAEVLTGLMHSVFDPLVENIFAHGGRIVSFAGDGIMALFPQEGDARETLLHALSAAWTIQNSLQQNPDRQTVYGGFHFSVKIGIGRGTVRWGILRSVDGAKSTYYFRGPAVEDSARAEHAAQAGEIILAEDVHALLKDDVLTVPVGSHYRLSGLSFELLEPAPIHFPPVDVEITSRFMPEEVITQDVRGEFRQIVNLFMRIPDLPYDKLQEFTEIIFELREKFGGLLNRVDFGDKGCNLLMLWGAPVTFENDMARALNFILELRERVSFPVTAGVTYYVAHSGYLGSAMYEDYTCYGWGVNLASRFMMSAADGEVWIDERIARRVKNRFEFQVLGSQVFKGFAAAQQVFALKGRKSQEVLHQGEFVGREAELPRLIDFLHPIWQGRFAGLSMIWGDAGIGKSRLVYEVKESLAHGREILWALCHSDQILRNSFNPFRYWLLRYFGIDSGMDTAMQKQVFEARLESLITATPEPALARELDRLRSVLGNLLDLHWEDSFYERLDAEGRYNNTLNALIALIKAESLRQPVVIFLEDAQFLDEDSRAFLPRLKNALTAGHVGYPVAILVSSRRTGNEVALSETLIDQSIDLGPLSTQALFDLAEIYLGGKVSHDLIQVLERRSEGNPYFAEQILAYLQEEHLLEMSPKGWQITRSLKETSLPADVRALLVARLDQLPRTVRDVILTASVLGREFEARALAEMLKSDDGLVNELSEAERANIWSLVSPFRYLFAHGLLRDAAYAMQMRARRAELHAIALEALEKVYAGEEHHRYGELAYHADRGQLRQKARLYYTLAGKASADAYQNRQATEYLTRALAFIPADDMRGQFDLLTERAALYHLLGDRSLQLSELEALEKLAGQLGDNTCNAKVNFLYAEYHNAIGEFSAVVERAAHVMDLKEKSEDVDVTLDTYAQWALALLRLGKLESAMKVAQDGLWLAQTSDNRVKEGNITNSIGLIALEQKDPASSRKYLERALAIAQEVGDRRLEAKCLNNLGNTAGFIAYDYASARMYYQQSYAILHERGDRAREGIALTNMGWSAGMQGDFAAARTYQEHSLIIAREVGDALQETYILINLSAVAAIQQDAHSSIKYAREACALARKTSERSGEAWAWMYLGYGEFLADELAAAEKSFHESILIREELGQSALKMEPLAGLIEIRLKQKDLASALKETEKILAHLGSGGTFEGAEEPLRIYHACYLALHQNLDPRAKEILSQAHALLDSQTALMADKEARRMFVDNVPWRHAIQQAWSDLLGS